MPTENNTARPEKNTDRAQRPARKPFKKRSRLHQPCIQDNKGWTYNAFRSPGCCS